MDYEKAYREALEKAKRALYCDDKGYVETDKDLIMSLFPELKESKDEQSKEWILEYLRDGLQKSDEQFKGQFKAAINWLEKQGVHE